MIKYKYELKEIDETSVSGDVVVHFKDGSKQIIGRKIFDINSLLKKVYPKGRKVLLCFWKDGENIYSAWQLEGFAEVNKVKKGNSGPIKYGKAYSLCGAGFRFPSSEDQIIK